MMRAEVELATGDVRLGSLPVDGVTRHHILPREYERDRRLEAGEEERLLAACGPHLRALVKADLETGCGVGERLSLQWHQYTGIGMRFICLLRRRRRELSATYQ
jgi:integrase